MVISFSVKEARDQLLNEGVVCTFRWNKRKQTGKDWANSGRLTKKICDVHIEEIKRIETVTDLNPYVSKSGFKTKKEWLDVIMSMKLPKHGLAGWLYKVTIRYPENCTLCGQPFTKNKDGGRILCPYPPQHYLCFPCLKQSIDSGIGRLNKILATGNLDLSIEEIADTIKPEPIKPEPIKPNQIRTDQK
ncbi:hypothetical protein ES703_33450 [subsurface metagenome]